MVSITLRAYGEAGAIDPLSCARPSQESVGTLGEILHGIAFKVAEEAQGGK
jgi:hypothetical protein